MGHALAVVPAIPPAVLSLLAFPGPFAFAPARAAVRVLAVAFLTDCRTAEAALDMYLGCLGRLCPQPDPCRGGRETGSRQRLERVAP
jgi:hypothetical protein